MFFLYNKVNFSVSQNSNEFSFSELDIFSKNKSNIYVCKGCKMSLYN